MATTYTGTSIVDYLKSVGQASDYTTRKNLATQQGILNYTGTSSQNTQLLGMLNKPVSSTPIPTQTPAQTPIPTALTAGQFGGAVTPQPAPIQTPIPAPTSTTVGQGINLISGGNLQLGTNSEQVRQLQTLLNASGANLTIDGNFGALTQAAVKKFQAANGLTADGIVGSNTNAALTKGTPAKVASGLTTPESLTSENKIVVQPIIPGADNATPFVASITAAQDASIKEAEAAKAKQQKEVDDVSSSISSLLKDYGGKGQDTLDAEKAAGQAEKQAIIDEKNGIIQTKLAAYNALNVDAQGKAVTMNSIIGAQAQIKNVAAAEIGLLQADVDILQKKYDRAKDLIDRAIELKHADAKTQLEVRLAQLKLLRDNLTDKEKVTADLLDKQYKAQTLALSIQIANEKDINVTKLNQIQKYSLIGLSTKNTLDEINTAVRKSAIYANEIRPPVRAVEKSYTVTIGDEPQLIANKLGLTVEALMSLNSGVNWHNLQKGQKLNIDTSKMSTTTGTLSATDYNKGLNYVLNNEPPEAVELFKTDRTFQAMILQKANE